MSPRSKPLTIFFLRILAGGFVLFMLLIITIANRGEGNRWWPFIHTIPFGDKLGHIGLMGLLCLLCNLAITPRHFRFLPAFVSRATFVLFVLITLEELSQAFISTRSCDPLDWLADILGLAIGQSAAILIRKSLLKTS